MSLSASLVGVMVAAAVLAPGVLRGFAVRSVERRLPRLGRGATMPGGRRRNGRSPVVLVVGALRGLGRGVRRAARRERDRTADLRAGAATAAGLLTWAVLGPIPGALVAVGIVAVFQALARRAPHRTEDAVRAALPDVVDLFRLAVGAGLSIHQSVEVVAVCAPDPIGPALREVRRQVALGVRLSDALQGLHALGDPARPLVSALLGAARYGAPLSAALDRVAVDARLLRRRRAEERARRLPVQLLFPLVMCVLPAFGLLAVVPLLAGSLPSVSSPS